MIFARLIPIAWPNLVQWKHGTSPSTTPTWCSILEYQVLYKCHFYFFLMNYFHFGNSCFTFNMLGNCWNFCFKQCSHLCLLNQTLSSNADFFDQNASPLSVLVSVPYKYRNSYRNSCFYWHYGFGLMNPMGFRGFSSLSRFICSSANDWLINSNCIAVSSLMSFWSESISSK